MWFAVATSLSGCSSGGGGADAQLPAVRPPVVSGFTASPAALAAGESSTLAWSVVGANRLSIDHGIGDVTGLSSRVVSPAATTTYTLTASNEAGSVAASVTVTVSAAGPYPVGLSSATIQVGPVSREYRVYVPAGLMQPPKALVLALHGGGGEGMDVANAGAHPLSVFRTVADREGFVVIYPGGLPAADGSPAWNDCRADNRVASTADDLAFLDALIDRVSGEYGLPVSRVFMAGGSNGAQMSFAYAITRSAKVAAVATSGGNLPQNPKPGPCSEAPSRPIPILMTHGTADIVMPYDGGCVANLGGGCARGRVIGSEETRDYWLAVNGLTSTSPDQWVVDPDATDAGPANRFAYLGSTPVLWWRLDNAGHAMPSRSVAVGENADRGIQNRDIEFAEVAWDLFAASIDMSSPPDASAIQAARDYNFAVGGQTFVVVHDGQILDEAYANGGAADRRQLLASGTKGFTGLIGAIAASDGLFELDEPVAQRALPEWNQDPQKSTITYRHLLSMSSGLEELKNLNGWQEYLDAPVVHPPGSTFVYSGDPNIFGLALERRLDGESVVQYLDRKLFQPLGITSIEWRSNFSDGHPQLSGGAYMTALDWARFGEFVRRTLDGRWDGPPLLERRLFDTVFEPNSAHPAYGFYWWLKKPVPADLAALIDANNSSQYTRLIKPIVDDPRIPADMVMAAGAYGQRLYVIPSRGLTVVRNGPPGVNDFEDVELLGRLLDSRARVNPD